MKHNSTKNLEITNREEALSKSSLVPTNKGYNLMLKMGYQVGHSLGKSSSTQAEVDESPSQKHLLEPIKVTLKSDRAGLGQEEERKQRNNEIEQYIKRLNENRSKFVKNTTEMFIENKKIQFQLRKLRHSLHKAQRIKNLV